MNLRHRLRRAVRHALDPCPTVRYARLRKRSVTWTSVAYRFYPTDLTPSEGEIK